MATRDVLLIVLVIVLLGALPVYPYSRSWGVAPAGIVGVLLIVLLLLFAFGRL